MSMIGKDAALRAALAAPLALLAALALVPRAAAQDEPVPRVRAELSVEPRQATVGATLDATLVVELADEVALDPPRIGPELGPFVVRGGDWSGPQAVADGGRRWVWRGQIAAYRTGELELPPITVRVQAPGAEPIVVATEPLVVSVQSVLAEGEPDADIADLKSPVSVEPDYGPLVAGALLLLVLLAVASLLWWAQRHFAARLAAVPAPVDPFRRLPPHEWVYAELQKLLERRLAEQGRIEEFFDDLSRIVKRYLGGRYRVELMERTTGELSGDLARAGAPQAVIPVVVELLVGCDRVKFARELPPPEACREAIEQAYRVVDATRPVEQAPGLSAADARGAA
jgi:hypothetical protein